MQPLNLAKVGSVLDDVLVRGQEDLELTHSEVLLKRTTLGRITLVRDHPDRGCPLGELTRPVGHGREWHDDEVRASLSLHFNEEGNEGNRLDSLSETLLTLLA